MSRDAPVQSDSGWVFFETGYDGSKGEYCSLYELSLKKPDILPFLALPVSSRVIVRPGWREVIFNGVKKTSGNSELLKQLAESPAPSV